MENVIINRAGARLWEFGTALVILGYSLVRFLRWYLPYKSKQKRKGL